MIGFYLVFCGIIWQNMGVPNGSETATGTPLPIHLTFEEQGVMATSSLSAQPFNPQLLLAEAWDVPFDPTGWWLSEKLDGVRAYWDGETLWSRNGNPFYAPEWFTRDLPDAPLDGELFGGRGNFARAMGIVRRRNGGSAWNMIQFCAFDVVVPVATFEDRMWELLKLLPRERCRYARIVYQAECSGLEHLRSELARILMAGGEGVMLRKPLSHYEHGRSRTLVKVKEMSQWRLGE